MRKRLTPLLLFVISMASGQHLTTIDSLMLSASFEEVLTAISRLEQAGLPPDKGILLKNKRAEALIHLGRFEDAEKILNEQAGTGNSFFHAIRLSNSGLLYMHQGRFDLAEKSLLEAIRQFEADGNQASLEAAQAISYLGLVYNASGNYSRAQEQLSMALNIREKMVKGNHELIAASYNDLGLAYANIDNDKALDFYEKALKIYEAIHGKEHPKIAIASINNGLIYRKLQLYGDAVNNFETALKIWEKIYPNAHPAKAFALMNLGETYLVMGNPKASRGYYERALDLFRQSYGEKHPDIAQVLNALGNIELAANHYDAALQRYQQAIIANVNNFQSLVETTNPPLDNFYNGYVLLYSLLYKAEAFERRYAGRSLRLTDLLHSLQTLQHCDSLIDNLRQQTSNESDKIALGVIANDVYANGVRIASETALNALRKKSYMELAFYFAEKSKSAVLLESISDANAKSFAGIPQVLMDEEQDLKSAIAQITQKLAQKPDHEEEKKLRETAYSLNRRYEAFTKKLETDFPQYYNLKFNAASPSMKEIMKIVGPGTALISYFIDERNSRLYSFVITKNKYKVYERALPAEFDKYVTGFRNSIYFSELKSYKLTAGKLAALLIPKLPHSIRSLVILPTGRLSVLPFEALVKGKKIADKNFETFPYLIDKYNIRYEFSASLILQKNAQEQDTSTPAILLCAPVEFPGHSNLPDLPGTQSEVAEISKLFADGNLKASVNLFEKANESLIKENNKGEFNLVHLATHGVVDEYNPELSRIFLQSTSAAEDGNLFSGEIYNLRLPANLVTLSACQTGLGKISKGEGVIGLSRALVYAGARNIIVSYWSVADESTAELMKDFYRLLLKNRDMDAYSTSLQQAKIRLRQHKEYSAPYYWAPFILIGF